MLNKFKLRTSILFAVAAPIVIFILAALLVLINVNEAMQATHLVMKAQDARNQAQNMVIAVSASVRGVRGYILTQDTDNKSTALNGDRDFQTAMEELKELLVDSDQKNRISQLASLQAEIMQIATQEVALVDKGDVQAAINLAKTAQLVMPWKNFKGMSDKFREEEERILAERMAKQESVLKGLGTIAWGSCLFAALLTAALGLWTAGRISKALSENVNTLASSSAEIAATMEQHERTVLQQTSSISETTATTEELRASAQLSSNQAENAASVVKKALQMTEEGAFASEQAKTSIADLQNKVAAVAGQILQLSEQAGQIGLIAKVVGDLASETNMLALNASVEAARAGENGKGFAVVASEVRKLADQSKKSAERANALVADIQKATNSAVMVAEEGGKTAKEALNIAARSVVTFHSLAECAGMIDQNAQQVVLNSRQQAEALSQIATAMKNLNAGSTEMAAGTKQTKLGLKDLTDAANAIKTMIEA